MTGDLSALNAESYWVPFWVMVTVGKIENFRQKPRNWRDFKLGKVACGHDWSKTRIILQIDLY